MTRVKAGEQLIHDDKQLHVCRFFDKQPLGTQNELVRAALTCLAESMCRLTHGGALFGQLAHRRMLYE